MPKIIKFSLKKLARDKVTERFAQNGITFTHKLLSGEEFTKALKAKMVEEVQEIYDAQTVQELEEEIADLQEVLSVLIQKANLCEKRIAEARAQKRDTFGSLLDGVYFETIQVPEDHPDVAHFRKNPEKYPELI